MKPTTPPFEKPVQTPAYQREERLALENGHIQEEAAWELLILGVAKSARAKEAREHYGQFGQELPWIMEPHELANVIWERMDKSGKLYFSPLDPSTWDRPNSMAITEDGWAQCAVAYVWAVAKTRLADFAGKAAEQNQATTALEMEKYRTPRSYPSAEDTYLRSLPYDRLHGWETESIESYLKRTTEDVPEPPTLRPPTYLDPETGEPEAPNAGREKTYGALRCGQHQGTVRGIKIHQRAGEPLCESDDPLRWESILITRLWRLTCADWDWYRYVKECPTCGYQFRAKHQRSVYCQMPCKGD